MAILAFSTIVPALAYAAPKALSEKDWEYTNGNSWSWNYSPETQINKDNVQNLEVKWVFPLEGSGAASPGIMSLNPIDGSTTPPIVRNGKVYVTTNYLKTYAIDARNGKELWAYSYDVDINETSRKLNIDFNGLLGVLGYGHLHGFRYWEGGNALLVSGMACDFYGINADTGENSFWVKDLCVNIPGNLYKYRQGTVSQTNIGTYDKGNQFIFVLPGAMHSLIYAGDFRHTTIGVDMDTHQILWRLYSFPPQDHPTKDWALQECDIGYFSTIPCSDVAAQAPENLEWDWAEPGQTPDIYGGVTANWGDIVVDEDTGIIYTNTGNQGPFTYVGTTPGPRLYGSTIMAIDATTGQRVWWLQPFPRDPYDYDCNWGGILADVPGLGKVYMKGCKEGRLNVIDATTGEPIYVKDVIDEQYELGQITKAGTLEPNDGGVKYHYNDIFNTYDIREMKSPDNSNYCGRPCDIYPFWSNGLFGTDMSYDPDTGTLFNYAAALQVTLLESPEPVVGQSVSVTQGYAVMNTSIIARDAATGEIKWTYYYDPGQQRSAMVVTPDLVFAGFTDGYVRFFNKITGEEISDLLIGSDMKVGLTTGQDSDGNQKIFTMIGQGSSALAAFSQGRTPGTLIAVGLSESASPPVTVTSTQSTTLTSSATVTTTTEVPTGLPAEYTYALAAVAVIAIIAAVVLAMGKR
jgi:outer membrane protein assembly factor BamB